MGFNWAFWRNETKEDTTEDPSAIEYVDWLLQYLIKKSILEIAISKSATLPGHEDSRGDDYDAPLPALENVINRLKVMSGVNPVRHPKPVRGQFELPRGNHAFVFHCEFDDRDTSPRCKMRMKIR